MKVTPSLKDPRKGASFRFPQKWGPYGNRRPFPKPYLAYPSGTPVKEPALQVSLIELPRKCRTPKVLLHSSFIVSNIRNPFQVSQECPMEGHARLQSLPLHILQRPQ